MSDSLCPHCQAANPFNNSFCQSCGKALARNSGGPRVLTADAMPTSAVGHVLVSDELAKQMKRVFQTLMGVGIFQIVVGGILLAVLNAASKRGLGASMPLLLVAQFGVAFIFVALAFWARKSPLPAAIVGLALYGTLIVLNVIQAVSHISEGGPRSGIGGIGVGWLDIAIMVILARGIQAALKYKQLQESAA